VTAPALSIIVVFHDMRREAARTLHTLATGYQRGVQSGDYEVLAVDSNSRQPLSPTDVAAFGPQFRHMAFTSPWPSPCAAVNHAVSASRAENVMVCIDGARMLSPRVVHYALAALRLSAHPFVYTLGMHLGHKPQNESIEDGYCQSVEDRLLETIDWRGDGYRLFDISSVALSSGSGYLSRLSESNCFALRRADFIALGGLDERFTSPGGGLVNLDFFNIAHEHQGMQPVMLLGEATFHQFHGGVATNVPRREHPWPRMAAEYAAIRGKPFASAHRTPDYLGWMSPLYHGRLLGGQ
jgi:hypothetical protein